MFRSTMTVSLVALLAGAAPLAGCDQSPIAQPAAAAARTARPVPDASPVHPVVVELFQSQGCSSCPPADVNVNALAGRPDVLALSFAVTYWDRLGWKDIFGSPAFTARQWDYAHHGGRAQVATPQVIVNGGPTVVGNDPLQLANTIAEAGPARGGPELSVTGTTLDLAARAGGRTSIVWLVRYDPRTQNVAIRAGENGGRTIPHRNIVRDLVRLGTWSGTHASFGIPAVRDPAWSSAVLVQQGTGGPITAARKL